ncbi:MAG: GH92 family glycosyl hydrolase [Bacteroidota bacterium]
MQLTHRYILLLALLTACAHTYAQRRPVDYVDCMIGNHDSRWMQFPGASMPFGMVKLSPDNQRQGWKAGYEYNIENIAGFSHIHSWTMDGLLMMPTTGPLQIVPGDEQDPDGGYRSRIRHERETAVPGYYSVFLEDTKIKAEMTATTRAGFQRYTFPKSDNARVMIDLQIDSEYGTELTDAHITKVSDREIQGYTNQQSHRGVGWNEYQLHFVIRVSKPFGALNGWNRNGVQRDVQKLHSGWDHSDFGAFVEFNTRQDEQILVQTGISFVSIEQARLNLDTEITLPFGWNFDAVYTDAGEKWNNLLGAIQVKGRDETDLKKFYTNLYRVYVGRTIYSDVNGKYVDMNEKVQQLKNTDLLMYGGDAFWNTFWNLNQVWTLVTPEIADKWTASLLEFYDKGGWLCKGPEGLEYSGIMVASHEIELIVSSYQKGIHRYYDPEHAWRAMYHNQTEQGIAHPGGGFAGNRWLDQYLKFGYVPHDYGPVSNTLEYAFDDWAVSQMAKSLGKMDDYWYFKRRAHNYLNIWDTETGYMNMRLADGNFKQPFEKYCCSTFLGQGWVEGNAWQYSWFVPHDLKGLVKLMGKDEFNRRLEEGFVTSRKWKFNSEYTDENSLLAMGVLPINHGNQPNMQAAYLFNYSGKPWLTQKWAREIMDVFYGSGPLDGWPGDEDQGQMGGWYVMSAMGLFEMRGGCDVDPVYEIGSPIFDEVVIRLDPAYYPGGTFIIEAINNSKDNRYIQSASLNGKPLNKPWFYHRELVAGGKLTIIMGPEPNEKWGSGENDAPPSMSDEH